MDVQAFFRQYVQDRREQGIPGFTREAFPHLVRFLGHTVDGEGGLVCYTDLTPGQEVAQIRAELDYFRQAGSSFEWKVYELDTPANLKELLLEHGFVQDEEEAFLVFQLGQAQGKVLPPQRALNRNVRIERVTDEAGLRDIVAIQAAVWQDHEFDWLLPQLLDSLRTHPEQLSLYCAYVGEQAVGCGWTGFPPGSGIPELHGGSVLEQFRGQGIYSALYRIRFEELRERGFEFVTVDAAPMSRPILERIGFALVCKTWPMRMKF